MSRACPILLALTLAATLPAAGVAGPARRTTFGGDVDLTVSQGEAEARRSIVVHTYGGDVTIHVPQAFDAEVDVEVVENASQAGELGIESDLPLARSESGWHRSLIHLFQRVDVLHGRLASSAGARRLRVVAEGGKVRLLRSRS